MKLSKKQCQVILAMRKGGKFVFKSRLFDKWYIGGETLSKVVVDNLLYKFKLIEYSGKSTDALHIYTLTKLGNEIEL